MRSLVYSLGAFLLLVTAYKILEIKWEVEEYREHMAFKRKLGAEFNEIDVDDSGRVQFPVPKVPTTEKYLFDLDSSGNTTENISNHKNNLKTNPFPKIILSQENKNSDSNKLPLCDDLFLTQIMHNTTFNSRIEINLQFVPQAYQIEELASSTGIKNGCWSPTYCRSRQSTAIIVPYRDREKHVGKFVYFMHQFLQKQHREYCIILSEQADKGQFNRAKLMNTGFDYAVKHHQFWLERETGPDCFIFADVDLLPENHKNLYGCFGYAGNHLIDKFDKYDYKQGWHGTIEFGICTVFSENKNIEYRN